MAFIYIFLRTNDVERIFHVLVGHLHITFGEMFIIFSFFIDIYLAYSMLSVSSVQYNNSATLYVTKYHSMCTLKSPLSISNILLPTFLLATTSMFSISKRLFFCLFLSFFLGKFICFVS